MRFEASASSLSPATSAGDALNSVEINQYEAIFVNVAEWGADKHHFTNVDISLNTIEKERPASSPTFVKDYLVNLDKKAGLSPEARKRFDAMDPECRTTYFVTTDGLPVTIQGTEGRDAKLQEVLHIDSLASMPWQSVWQRSISPLKEPLANAMCFFPVFFTCSDPQYVRNKVTATLGTSNWSFPLIMKKNLTPGRTEIRSYLPRSDFRISYQNLPRVLVEVDSTPSLTDPWPRDLVRMLLCGASVVRFANGFIDPFKQQKNFVLAAIYIGQTGSVQWHTLYQNRNEPKVRYKTEVFDFNEPIGRIKFALRLYNFYFTIEGESNANSEIATYKYQVYSHMPKLKSFYAGRGTKRDATDSGEGNARPRTRPRGDDPTELEAHGYIVEPDRIETEDGIFESLRKVGAAI
ncbi:hypothetical protein BDN71DRAFT_865655 [Pleurotus eryngii]|uniref:Uncharacterized protein n=1 Tax=Pleurotus eryngii TaxID=5323 RepID=A0A9P5ZWY3_PLEER|nr:hypothetical protein BDN71DRAFT_865655 [Pleurotus eryngii]